MKKMLQATMKMKMLMESEPIVVAAVDINGVAPADAKLQTQKWLANGMLIFADQFI